jgi:hypothetical protein
VIIKSLTRARHGYTINEVPQGLTLKTIERYTRRIESLRETLNRFAAGRCHVETPDARAFT